MFEIFRDDYFRYSSKVENPTLRHYLNKAISSAGFRAVVLYRLGRWCRYKKLYFWAGLLERLMHHLCHCWISVSADIGPGFLIAHVGGIVIGGETRIGRNCDIRQNVTFGGNFNKIVDGRSQPWVEDNVSFGVGAVVIGPVKIGSNAIIGANTVVTRDVPANTIFFGVPGRILKERWPEENRRHL